MLHSLSFVAAIAILAIPIAQADARSGGVRSTGAAQVGSMRSFSAPRSVTSARSVSKKVKPLQTTPALITQPTFPTLDGSSKAR
jgi:hypothetical protein